MQSVFTTPNVGLAGQLAHKSAIDSLPYPKKAQVTTINVGGTTDGVYTIRVTRPDGLYDDISYTASGDSAADIAAGLVAAAEAITRLLGILTAAVVPTDDVQLTFVEEGTSYAVSFPSNPGGNLSATLSASPSVANLPIGVFVGRDSDGNARSLDSSDTALDVYGLVTRSEAEITPQQQPYASGGYAAGRRIPVALFGDYWVDVEDAVDVDAPVFVRLTATGSEVAGAVRSDADGGDAVQIAAQFKRATSGAGRTIIRLLGPVLPLADDIVETANIAADAVTAAKIAFEFLAEQTGNGSEQDSAHTLGSAPSLVIPIFTELPADLAAGADVALGAHTSSVAKATVTTGVKYRLLVFK